MHGDRDLSLDSPSNGYDTSTNMAIFQWFSQYGATNYAIQISTDFLDWAGTQVDLLNTSNLNQAWGCGIPTCSDSYYWRVRPYNSDCYGDWSIHREFTFSQ